MLLLLQFLVFFLLHVHNSISSPHPDHITLLSIKSSISFPTKNSTFSLWTLTKPHCTFPYVKCDPSSNHVISLNLSSLSLTGAIPPQISNLSHLTYLNLSHNLFNSTFPTQLYLLKRLQTLSVYDNNLTGPIPSKPHLFPFLRYLNLAGNYFTGEIPKKIGFLPKLEYLDLAGNELTGPIPGEIGKLGNLKELRLGYFNAFTGSFPKEIGNLSNLVSLDAGYCNLTGEIPVEFGRLRNLDSVYLEVNGLSGNLRVFGELKKLKSLDLSNNVFTGEIPREFSGLRDLRLLNLFRNRLTGEIPGFIGEFPRLEVLQLWENDFTGEIPRGLGSNGRLKWLDVSTNRLTGSLPVDLCKGNSLTALITMRNGLVGEIPESLARCRSLNRLRMGQNRLNGSIPKGLFSLPGLKLVELPNNLLSGVFPDGDGLLSTSLEQITLCNNQLTGELPPTIGNFVGVQELLLDGNKFLGSIPSEIGKLQKLSKMDLSRNEFSGSIAPEISRCERLTFVDLSQNQLSGNIPMEIADLKILNYLNLSRNHLIGNIPPSMGSMLSLTSVDFSYNNLSGLVPETGQLSYFNSPSFMGNPNLCGASLGACKRGIANGGEGPHEKGVFSPLMKLLIVIGLLVCSIVFAIATIMKARALKKSSKACSWKLTTFQRLGFTCDDVLDCLKEDNIIGKGGAGIVYRGVMPNTESVAVKRLSVVSRGSSHDHGFNAEIQTLGSIRHRHIVKLLGFCSNYDTNLLIYEYMPNGSLGEMLHGEKGAHLHWEARYKIAVEAAKGLCYLHHDCSPLIVHRDIKSSNILLDSNFEAHVADFGLAKFLQNSDTSECMSAIAGSYGYIAPEYVYTLNVNEKSDVYSFGVVLLELVTGKRPVGEFGDGVDLVQWIRKMTNGKKERVVEIIDPRISKIPLHDITHVFYVAMLCVEEQAIERPTMREVVHMLTELPTSPSTMRGDSPPPSSDLESPRTYASGCSPLLDLSV